MGKERKDKARVTQEAATQRHEDVDQPQYGDEVPLASTAVTPQKPINLAGSDFAQPSYRLSCTAPGTGAGTGLPFFAAGFLSAVLPSAAPLAPAGVSDVDGVRADAAGLPVPEAAVEDDVTGGIATVTDDGADAGGGTATGLMVTRLLFRVSFGTTAAPADDDVAAPNGFARSLPPRRNDGKLQREPVRKEPSDSPDARRLPQYRNSG